MKKYAILLGYFDKQIKIIEKLKRELETIDVAHYESGYVFSLKTQQFYTATEDLFKQVAKAFENHIDNLSFYHKELLIRMNTEIPGIRPVVISGFSLAILDKIRAFRHFIRHAYDCELDPKELKTIQDALRKGCPTVENDLQIFRTFISKLSEPTSREATS